MEFLAYLEEEWRSGSAIQTADWSAGVRDYISQRTSLAATSSAPAKSAASPAGASEAGA